MKSGMHLSGAKELLDQLNEMGKQSIPINRRAVNLATSPIVRAAKRNCPVDKGDLRKSQTKKVYNRGSNAMGIVGADADYIGEDGQKPSHYDHLIEFGHETKDGKHVPANPYLRTAWEESINEAQRIYGEEVAAGIEKAALKGK
jgi:HK97 gp10 family phage protein